MPITLAEDDDEMNIHHMLADSHATTKAEVLALFRRRLDDAQPFAECDGPDGSCLLFYGLGKRHVVVQVFAHGAGWCEYVSTGIANTRTRLDFLGMLQDEVDERRLTRS